MGRPRHHIPLNVFLNRRLVGVLKRETSGAINFQYNLGWLDWPSTFPISLSLPLREDRYIGAPVFNVFDNLLPDNEPIRRRVAERVGAGGTDAYSLLTALGHDCVGAMQFLPEGIEPGPVGSADGKIIDDDEIGKFFQNLGSAQLGMDEDKDFRISIAGAQEKTALLRRDGQWYKPTGTSATTHILKPQIGELPNGIDLSNSVENEFLCLKLLDAFGVPTAHVEIGEFGGKKALIVERFDRLWTKDKRLLRLPQEDCCQALSVPPTRKYQSEGGPGMRDILGLLKSSDSPEEDIATFMHANIAFWLLGATDGHAKNFSIFLSPGGRFRLTPLYDVLSAQPSFKADQIQRKKFKLAMSVGKSRHYLVGDIMPHHFIQTAEISGIDKSLVQKVFEDLRSKVPQAIKAVVEDLPTGFPESLVDAMTNGIVQRLELLVAKDKDALF